jgi:hypothetical protein
MDVDIPAAIGILYLLLKGIQIVPRLKKDEKIMLISQTRLKSLLDRLEGITYDDGEKIHYKEKEEKIHKHDKYDGTYSPIPLLSLAIEMFPTMTDRLVKHANTAGTLIWEKGL